MRTADTPPVAANAPAKGQDFPQRLFVQQLAMLLDAGIPMLEALDTLREHDRDAAVASVLADLAARLREGHALSVAMAMQEGVFDPLLLAAVGASERTGQLTRALSEHARYLGWQQALRARLMAAATYPAVLLLVGSAVLMFLLFYVLPQFSGVLDSRQAAMPWASRVLIDWGRWVSAHPVGLGLGGVAGVALVAGVSSLPQTRYWLRGQAWAAPVLGPVLRTLSLARLYRTMGLLLSAGVPVHPALGMCLPVVAPAQRQSLARAMERVHDGERLSVALDGEGLCTAVAHRMLAVGERSGQLAVLFERCAAFHDEEISRLSDWVTRLVNPVLMLVMGVLIGGIVVLMYLPIFQLAEQYA